ncbi:cyclin-D3-1-like [Actinidia eriantha]|uniref:cyclin-D3-1-like n=1 Tax=Actinidia eriantha TaxID=165200 RepID=UPI00258D9088|nr:cyclin-D3-1-like [Actinidia eriantha]
MSQSQSHHQQLQQNLPFILDALYCQEEDYFGDEEEQSCYNDNIAPPPPLLLPEQDLFWEEEELTSLLSKERENQFHSKLVENPSLVGLRREAVEWVLKANVHYSFSALTAVLAVNYFDRFLFSFHFQREKPWMTQLAAVACLSLAAKVEETQVPFLLDLQVEEPRYVFEAKTIQRMEILVLSTLGWKMNPVTPLSFLDHITRRLGLKNYPCLEILKRCHCLTLSLISDSKFICYLPSVLATATMLHIINGVDPCLALDYQTQLLGTLGINKAKVEDCYKLILDSTPPGFLGHQSNKRKIGPIPGSPNGVVDFCFSSDSSNDSWAVAAAEVLVSSSPEPHSKRSKTH